MSCFHTVFILQGVVWWQPGIFSVREVSEAQCHGSSPSPWPPSSPSQLVTIAAERIAVRALIGVRATEAFAIQSGGPSFVLRSASMS